ncbi:MAG TPA: hypothetical protein VKY26_02270 [Actinomycetota bacterium]|nr:hypothetical protein [Actinomycetota bacterium]
MDPPASALVEPRPGAEIRPDVVNVFEEGVSAGPASGLRLAPLGGRKAGDAIALSVRAWVRNMAYDKDLWIDVSLAGDGGELLHEESVSLSFLEPAGGDGDFFTIGTAVPAPKADEESTPILLYRLYGQMGGQLYTDGVLHRHTVATGTKAPATETKAGATKARTPRASAKPAVEQVEEPAKPAPSSRTAPKPGTAKTSTTKVGTAKTATPKTATAKTATAKTGEKAAAKAPEKPVTKAPAARKRTAPKD